MPEDRKYDYGYDGDGGPDNGNDGDLSEWIPVLIFLVCFPPVGVVLLVLKLMGITGKGGRRQGSRHPYDLQREASQTGGERRYYRQAQVVNQNPKKKKKYVRKPDRDPGRGFTIGGAIMAGIFALGAADEFFSALSRGGLLASLGDIFTPLAFCGVGLFLMYLGVTKSKKAKRYRKYMALIGKRDAIPVAILAQAMGLSVRRVCGDLQDMLDEGVIPMGYLDMGAGRLVLTAEGIQDPPPEPEKEAQPPKGMEREEAVLTEIREVNDAIADAVMSAKIDHIGEITSKIFVYLREKPDKEGQLRSFLSYYLPTTLKILRAYAQMEAQGIEGENIKAAKSRIEGMMDKVVDGFEKQLDRLFQDDAMDIATDVEVLERMLDKEGLGGQGMTLGG